MIPEGRTPLLPAAGLQQMGFAPVTWPTVFTYAYAAALSRAAAELRSTRTRTIAATAADLIPFQQFNDLVGLSSIRRREHGCAEWAAAE